MIYIATSMCPRCNAVHGGITRYTAERCTQCGSRTVRSWPRLYQMAMFLAGISEEFGARGIAVPTFTVSMHEDTYIALSWAFGPDRYDASFGWIGVHDQRFIVSIKDSETAEVSEDVFVTRLVSRAALAQDDR